MIACVLAALVLGVAIGLAIGGSRWQRKYKSLLATHLRLLESAREEALDHRAFLLWLLAQASTKASAR